ncbi:hypothetical protein [Nocardia lijiangensis]|uniref:hypothetical protein n=1 Tax=Nocardia lijiangensis TaxID=299618 RepID=UPI0008314BAC|nr:hypothetical protein [Nocardia lijiangensis]
MAAPTPLQAHLLKAVQNLAYDNQQLRERARAASEADPSPEVVRTLDIGERSGEQLEGVALGIGVPKAWIDYARAAGQRGVLWQPGQVMLGSGYVPRETVIAALAREIHGLQDMAGVGAAHVGREEVSADAVAAFRRVMGMTWQRLGAVSHALTLSEEERHQVWSRGSQHWSTVVAARVRGYSDHDLLTRWNTVAGTDFSVVAAPVLVLQWAGITQEDITAQMPASPDRMVELAATALTEPTSNAAPLAVAAPGRDHDTTTAITAAIDATGVNASGAGQLDSADDAVEPAADQRELGPGAGAELP